MDKYLKISCDENGRRLLESLWRSVRRQFTFKDRTRPLDECIRTLKNEVLPALDLASDLEKRAKEILNVSGIDFEDCETIVKASGGFRQLLEMMNGCLSASEGAGSPTLRAVMELYGSSLDQSKAIRRLLASARMPREQSTE